MTDSKVTVVNIISVSYSGSTWLNLLLGAHSEGFSVGEMTVFERQGTGYCKFHGNECPFWERFDHTSEENPFLQIARLSGKRVLVVNNSPGFIGKQEHPGIESRFIHLVRDGRAVAASTLRKYPDQTMWHAARSWARGTRKDVGLLSRQPAEKQTRVHYEQLVADTAGLVERLSGFVGYGYEPSVLENWEGSGHFLGGSLGILKKVADKQDVRELHYRKQKGKQRSDWDYYDKTDPKKFVDERWKQELTDGQLRVFGLLAGRQNRGYGYPPSLDRESVCPRVVVVKRSGDRAGV